MAYVTVIAMLALIEYLYFGIQVGAARGRAGIEAPATTGDPAFERAFRAHQNTLEHLVLFLPGLWLFSYSVSPLWAAAIGIFWPVGRLVYALGYYKAPEKRMPGLLISMPPVSSQ